MSTDSPRFRLAALGVVVLSLFAALYARLWYLQVLDSRTFIEAAASNQVRLVYEEAPRGRILDRKGLVLVDNQRSQVIAVRKAEYHRLEPDQRAAVSARLAALLGITEEELAKRIDDVRYSQYKPVPVAENVPEEVFIHVRERAEEFPSVEATVLSRRAYPNGSLAAHVLGYVGEINAAELDARKSDAYRLGDTIGKAGVELVYESDLRGEPGVEKLQVNSAGDVLGPPLSARPPVPGDDIQLTIDLDIQRLAEESLQQGLQVARGQVDRINKRPFPAPAGAVVVLDVRDGSVVAMASNPTYNPGDFVDGIKPDVYRILNDPANHYPLNNRAITGQYAPGSTFKLVTAVAAAQRGLMPRSIVDAGVHRLRNCRGEKCEFQNAGRTRFGRVDLRRSLTVSSDVYYYQLGEKFWVERSAFPDAMQQTSVDFGLGTKTGIPLATDKAGVVPSPEWKKQFCANPKVRCVDDRWFTGDSVNMAIGQGNVLVTPLQLANLYSTFANGGTRYAPKVLGRVLEGGSPEIVKREEAFREAGRIDLSPHREAIRQGLRGVISQEEGTAFYAFSGFPKDFPVAGKTGTAQVAGKQDTAVFAAYAPFDDPQYAVAVVMEEAGFGGTAAAPVARRILEGIATGNVAAEAVRLGQGND